MSRNVKIIPIIIVFFISFWSEARPGEWEQIFKAIEHASKESKRGRVINYKSGNRFQKSRYLIENGRVYYRHNSLGPKMRDLMESERDFVVFSQLLARGKKGVYFDGKLQRGVDLKTFKYLKEGYYLDKDNVYFEGRIVEGADSKSFVIGDSGFPMDKSYRYNFGRKIGPRRK